MDLMNQPPNSIDELVNIFGPSGSKAALALGLHQTTISSWRRTLCIGRENWDLISAKAAERGVTVDANVLHRLCRLPGSLGTNKRGRPAVRPRPTAPHPSS
jgi:hypothetical protein